METHEAHEPDGWYADLAAVPGVEWRPPVEVQLQSLKPGDPLGDGRVSVKVGHTIGVGRTSSAGDVYGFESACSWTSQTLRTSSFPIDPEMVIHKVCQGLALAGPRTAFHEVLLLGISRLQGHRHQSGPLHVDTRIFGWIEAMCLADMALVVGDPSLGFREDAFERLARLYQAEGFVRDAIRIQDSSPGHLGPQPENGRRLLAPSLAALRSSKPITRHELPARRVLKTEMDSTCYGGRFASCDRAARFALDQAADRRSKFEEYHGLLATVIDRTIRGEQTFQVVPAAFNKSWELDRVEVIGLSPRQREELERSLKRERLERRGAWFLPEKFKVQFGVVQFPWLVSVEPRFAVSAATSRSQEAEVSSEGADAVLLWSLIAPMMEDLYLPIRVCSGYWLGGRNAEKLVADWTRIYDAYEALGIDTHALHPFQDGPQWANLWIHDLTLIRQNLAAAWSKAPADVGQRVLVRAIGDLADEYYVRAREGSALRSSVLRNQAARRALTAIFAGDWLTFLEYLGEQPHKRERIATAVPATTVISPSRKTAADIAARAGLNASDIQHIMTAFWGGEHAGPIEQRTEAMREWWQAFDEIHASQTPGMPTLWGLLGDRVQDRSWLADAGRYSPRLYEQKLPASLLTTIEDLWSTKLLPRSPDRLVTERYPHAAFAEALGPAAQVWETVALSSWCECKPYIDFPPVGNLPRHCELLNVALREWGCPIDLAMFEELEASAPDDSAACLAREAAPDRTFGQLNAIVSRYRRRWLDTSLEMYIRELWQRDVRRVGDAYHRHEAEKGKEPTPRQFAAFAEPTANRWFGGNLSDIAAALALPAPPNQT